MTNIILVYQSSKIPAYVFQMLDQLLQHRGNAQIYFITNKIGSIWDKYKNIIKIIDSDKLEKTKHHTRLLHKAKFGHRKIRIFYENPNYWFVTLERFFFIEDLVRKYELEDIIHLECDILIYRDINTIMDEIHRCNANHMVCCDSHRIHISNAVSYYRNLDAISRFNQFIVDTVCPHGINDKIKPELLDKLIISNCKKINPKFGFICDMTLAAVYYQQMKDKTEDEHKIIDLFPSLPDGYPDEPSRNCRIFSCLFDGAMWGKHAGGWPKPFRQNSSMGAGHVDPKFWVGQELALGHMKLVWKDDKPYAEDMIHNKCIPLFNLHIHSKEMETFLSK